MNLTATIAVILARAGSKGLAKKNERLLHGKPLLEWTIDHALAARTLDHVVVSTDGPALAEIARKAGAAVIDRPAKLADDHAPIQHAVRHAVEAVEAQKNVTMAIIVILYANVPLRPDDLTDRAVEKLRHTGADSVQSVCPVGKTHPFWMKRLGGRNHDKLEPYQENEVFRRQDLPPVYLLDGGIIAVTRQALFSDGDGHPHAFLGTDRRAIITEPGEVVDVDTAMDLALAEAIVRSASKS